MSTFSPSRLGIALVSLGLPLLAGSGAEGPEFGATIKVQRPLGEYQTKVLDSGLGYGLGFRTRYDLRPDHGLSVRLDYDYFLKGGGETRGSNYLLEESIRTHALSLALAYEWRYSGTTPGGYLLIGPIYQRWTNHHDFTYSQTLPGSIPASYSLNTTPSNVGIDAGWGYRGGTNSVTELHFVTSKYGSAGATANSIQISFTQFW